MRELRIAAVLLVIALLSFAGASGYVYFSVRANIVETIRAGLTDEAARNMAALQARVAELMRDVDTWSRSPFARRMLQARAPDIVRDMRSSITALAANRNELMGLAVFDAQGQIVIALRDRWIGKLVSEPARVTVAAGRRFQSDITDATGVGVRGLEFGIPIFDDVDPGRVIGGVAAIIDWSALISHLADARVETRPQDATHRVVLINRDQDVLYYTGMLDGGETEANGWDLLHGARIDSLAVAATSRTVGPFMNPEWTLHQFVDEVIAFAPADRMGRTLILTSGLVLVISGLATAFTIQKVLSRRAASAARRIKALAEAAVEGIVICEDDRIVEVNASFCGLVGMGPEELTARSLLGFVRLEDRRVVRRLLESPEHATAMIRVQSRDGGLRAGRADPPRRDRERRPDDPGAARHDRKAGGAVADRIPRPPRHADGPVKSPALQRSLRRGVGPCAPDRSPSGGAVHRPRPLQIDQ